MDAVILVGGQGNRLRPLTDRRHKSLVPLCNQPFIEYLFDWLARSRFERAILSLGVHNEDLATAYPAGEHCGVRVEIVQESERLESGGAIRYAVQQAGIEKRFAVLNGDVFVDFDFNPALAAHERTRAELTLALHDVADPSGFGVAVTNDDGLITEFVEKPPAGTAPSNAINAGVWIFERHIADEIPQGTVRVEETLFPALVSSGRRVLGYRFDGPWEDVGVPSRYRDLNLMLLDRGNSGIAQTATIGMGATVNRSVVGPGTEIGTGSLVTNSVLWENVTVGDGARIEGSVIADGVVVGEGATLEGAVVGAGARIAAGVVVPTGATLATESRYDGSR